MQLKSRSITRTHCHTCIRNNRNELVARHCNMHLRVGLALRNRQTQLHENDKPQTRRHQSQSCSNMKTWLISLTHKLLKKTLSLHGHKFTSALRGTSRPCKRRMTICNSANDRAPFDACCGCEKHVLTGVQTVPILLTHENLTDITHAQII